MQFLLLLLKVALFALAVVFAAKNTDPVTVHYYFDGEWQAPLVFVMLVAFGIGVAAGLGAALPRLIRQRRRIAALQRQVRERPEEGGAAVVVPPDVA